VNTIIGADNNSGKIGGVIGAIVFVLIVLIVAGVYKRKRTLAKKHSTVLPVGVQTTKKMVQFDENGSAKSEAPVGETERNLEVTNNMVMEASSASKGEIQLKKVEDFKEECEGTPSPLDKRKASGLKIETTPARKQSTKRKKTVNDCSIEDTEYELEAQENPVPLENRMDNLKLGTLLDTNEDALMARGLTSGTSLGDIESRHQLFDYSPTHVRTRNGNGNGNGDFPTWERQQSQNLSISDVPDTVALRRDNSGLLSQAKRIN
jgi:hypothetical protein